ncbi:MAG: hypothetical protein JJ913_04670 [Rhizobiaceae bacterium]|nr:hypothetical protein [Rhizobiaceae bacterium]
MIRLSRRPAIAAALFLLGGCASLAPAAVGKLATFDPLSAEPGSVAVAVKTDERLVLRTGDVVMRITLKPRGAEPGFDEAFDLEVLAAAEAPAIQTGPHEHVLVARVAPVDHARLASTQQRARAARGQGRGAFSVAIRGACRSGDVDPADLVVSTYLRTTPGEPYFPLTREIRLARAIGADAVAAIPPCDRAATAR